MHLHPCRLMLPVHTFMFLSKTIHVQHLCSTSLPNISIHTFEPNITLLSLLSPTQKCVFVHVNTSESLSPQVVSYVNRPFRLLRNMPHTKAPMASVEQSVLSKVPVLMAGDILPATMQQFEHACMNYFIHKKVIMDDQVSLIMGGILDDCVGDWIISYHDGLISLPFSAFMTEFRTNYLAKYWEKDTLL